jgi:hypothetical protein
MDPQDNHALGVRVALTGAKGSGKSTMSEHLVACGYTELAFAELLKKMIIAILGVDSKWVYDPEFKETVIPELGVSGRELCQVIGTECFRETLNRCLPQLRLRGGSIWIHALLSALDRVPAEQNVVVSDCRFPDEYRALRAAGFTTYEVVRQVEQNCFNKHASEQGCPHDDQLVNAGTREELWRQGRLKIEKTHPNSLSRTASTVRPDNTISTMSAALNTCFTFSQRIIGESGMYVPNSSLTASSAANDQLTAMAGSLLVYASKYNTLKDEEKVQAMGWSKLKEHRIVTDAILANAALFRNNAEWKKFSGGSSSSSSSSGVATAGALNSNARISASETELAETMRELGLETRGQSSVDRLLDQVLGSDSPVQDDTVELIKTAELTEAARKVQARNLKDYGASGTYAQSLATKTAPLLDQGSMLARLDQSTPTANDTDIHAVMNPNPVLTHQNARTMALGMFYKDMQNHLKTVFDSELNQYVEVFSLHCPEYFSDLQLIQKYPGQMALGFENWLHVLSRTPAGEPRWLNQCNPITLTAGAEETYEAPFPPEMPDWHRMSEWLLGLDWNRLQPVFGGVQPSRRYVVTKFQGLPRKTGNLEEFRTVHNRSSGKYASVVVPPTATQQPLYSVYLLPELNKLSDQQRFAVGVPIEVFLTWMGSLYADTIMVKAIKLKARSIYGTPHQDLVDSLVDWFTSMMPGIGVADLFAQEFARQAQYAATSSQSAPTTQPTLGATALADAMPQPRVAMPTLGAATQPQPRVAMPTLGAAAMPTQPRVAMPTLGAAALPTQSRVAMPTLGAAALPTQSRVAMPTLGAATQRVAMPGLGGRQLGAGLPVGSLASRPHY